MAIGSDFEDRPERVGCLGGKFAREDERDKGLWWRTDVQVFVSRGVNVRVQ